MNTARSFAAIAVATRYAAFAVLATVVNVSTQLVAIALYEGGNELYVAMAGGTATGLVTKYLLDRRWIFGVRKEPLPGNAARFAAYSTTGVLTTLLFWAVELGLRTTGRLRLAAHHRCVCGPFDRLHSEVSLGQAVRFRRRSTVRISGWGRYPVVECATASARGIVDVQRFLAGHTSLIPRGNGRSYGDASLNPRTHAFHDEHGSLPGLRLGVGPP